MSGADKDMPLEGHRARAIDLFVRQRTASSPAVVEELDAWLQAAPEHADAYADVERLWSATSEVAEDPGLRSWRQGLERGLGRRRFLRRAIAASLAAAMVGLSAAGVYELASPDRLVDQSFRTAIGQQATVTLPDGSTVTLNTDTLVRTRADKDRRLVYLDRGQAFFRVAKDPGRPFVVTAAGRTVTALGTAFDVRVDKGALKVVLVEGKVRVETIAPERGPAAGPAAKGEPAAAASQALATEMGPGSQLVATANTDWRVTRTDVVRETSWLNGQIVISDQPLGEAIEELNRYSRRKIVLDDPSLAGVRISGVFRPGDLDGFARALKTSGMAEVGQETNSEFRIVAVK
ncbi:MAG TPA: FecR domain-containing protein [Caulobacteraceae bacterium]|nr:FecR domain-containing protein [Caulobacteraceae bacterium]